MCIYWTCKYTLCGCIWDMDPSKCRDKRLCWGRRMITLESHTATCGDCWARGDKRVYEQQACDEGDGHGEVSKGAILDCESDADGSANTSDDEDYFSADEFLAPSPYSRPATPPLYYEQHSAMYPVSEDNDFDLTRACDPVDLASMGRDYRARRHRAAPSEYSSDGTDYFVSCEEYPDEESPDEEKFNGENDEDDLYNSIVVPPGRPKGLIKSLEDRSLRLYGSVQEYYPTAE
ncbi:hypothetical protein N7517_008050 [Penicillium concentricum]|uniref:Uncharacterized protein n=1 Tax=Penicillium concentricum TaxID=293559 RepID=A0A9W9RUD7_9EURO|nr:uncharacterized protein N7517_008050 [Penicillium concentricum]KAJ5365164.1 hypothetical protein N7517_008050 [Penicillium concentricum]